jgi:tRNA(Ile)-lysidine synthase
VKVPWIEEASKASKEKKVLVGVSGGLDSMALLHLLCESGFRKVIVCHLNHGLRGRDSGGDARFVKRAGEKLGFEVEAGKIDLLKRIEEMGESLETAGRKARHQFFGSCGRKYRCSRILLAHHADDQAETVLWNLMRGSLGCRGMRETTQLAMDGKAMRVVRPFLGTRKSELADWMEERGLRWREDASNAVSDVVRNCLRNEALPLLAEISKRDVIPNLVRAAETDEEWRGLLDWAVAGADVIDPQGRLHTAAMRKLPDVLKRGIFAEYLRGIGISKIDRNLLDRCAGLLDIGNAASLNLPGGGRLRRRSGRIFSEQF